MNTANEVTFILSSTTDPTSRVAIKCQQTREKEYLVSNAEISSVFATLQTTDKNAAEMPFKSGTELTEQACLTYTKLLTGFTMVKKIGNDVPSTPTNIYVQVLNNASQAALTGATVTYNGGSPVTVDSSGNATVPTLGVASGSLVVAKTAYTTKTITGFQTGFFGDESLPYVIGLSAT